MFTDDLDDQDALANHTNGQTANSTGNYRYDKEGRLIKDVQEEIDVILWRVDGKVKKIQRPLGSSKKNVTFDYDAMEESFPVERTKIEFRPAYGGR